MRPRPPRPLVDRTARAGWWPGSAVRARSRTEDRSGHFRRAHYTCRLDCAIHDAVAADAEVSPPVLLAEVEQRHRLGNPGVPPSRRCDRSAQRIARRRDGSPLLARRRRPMRRIRPRARGRSRPRAPGLGRARRHPLLLRGSIGRLPSRSVFDTSVTSTSLAREVRARPGPDSERLRLSRRAAPSPRATR